MSDTMPVSRDEALAICQRVVESSRAEQTEVNLLASRSGLTRFAGNEIHQSVFETDVHLMVRAAYGQRVGVATTNDVSDEGLRDVTDRACTLAASASPDEFFPGLPEPGAEPPRLEAAEATVSFGPGQRAAAVRECLEVARERGQTAAGACSADVITHAVANSRGISAANESAAAHMRMVFAGDDSSGYAEAYTEDAGTLSPRALAEVAANKCARSAAPVSVEPGRWDVILEPPAVTDMLFFLGMDAFNALACQEGRSPLCGRFGERVCGENITIVDDASDARSMRRSFDFEGVPTRRVELIVDGVARDVVHDSRTAAKEGTRSTGHALPPPSRWGPMPLNMFMTAGERGVDEMVAATERGLLITRTHYTNLVDPSAAILTGMTRDGTFLIEDGEVVGGVRNMRFTEGILDALSRVDMIGRDGWLDEYSWAPALRVRDFRLSGVTEF